MKAVRKFKIRRLLLVLLFAVVIVATSVFALGNKNLNKNENTREVISNKDMPAEVKCIRTTRLENLPTYDRALSLIGERYGVWEEGKNNFGSYYFFPSQLVNCIKVTEDSVRNSSNAEGYFVFNSEDIKDNYFPITVDNTYSKADDILNALLLVHEITHVRQYLDSKNGADELSCIDKEVEAFDASYNFYRWLIDENRKSVDLRLEHDQDLHPQLILVKTISEYLTKDFASVTEICNGDFGESCSGKITANRRAKIRDLVSQEDLYKKQCEL